ncbi:MAG: serine hydrolase [Polaribacter sp.]|nr:serine hydrolase [Polaribacter sp.]MDG1811101.1 serine hydrolase [Polaribacter sp.]MDG1993476.1 serine hydrolase [Polaribacter sp.]
MYKLTIVILVLVLFSSCKKKTLESTDQIGKIELDQRLTKKLEQAFKIDSIKGFSVAIVDEDGLVYKNGFGFSDIDTTKIYSAKTIQPIASISKILIGISLIKAEELGYLNFKDPINKFLPFKVINPQYPKQEILIEHLAYHTSSIIDLEDIYFNQYFFKDIPTEDNDYETYYGIFRKPEEKQSLENYLKQVFSKNDVYEKLPFSKNSPGEKRDYSNIGSDICALIIEKASKMEFKDFTKKHILHPLKMNSSGWSLSNTNSEIQSRLFVSTKLMLTPYTTNSYPSGWFVTSSEELGLLLTELIKGYNGNGSILTNSGFKKLYKKQTYNEKSYGCFIEYTDDWMGISDTMIGHNGSEFGVFSGMYFNPKRNTGKIIISNTDTDYFDDGQIWGEITTIWKSLIDYEIELNK